MSKLMDSPAMYLERFQDLYTPGPEVIFYKQSGTINYSYPSFKEAYDASLEMDYICYRHELHLSRTIKSGILNHIITLRVR